MAALARPAAPERQSVDVEDSLDRQIVTAWTSLAAHERVGCPVCGADMAPAYGAHARPIGGRCASCGSELR